MIETIGPKLALPVGEWSLDQKLRLLRDYLGANNGFLKATTKPGQRYYIDLFAGPGQVISRHGGDPADGSPLIAMRAGPPSFTQVHLVEKEPAFVASLRAHRMEYPQRDISIYDGDANQKVDEVLAWVPKTFPILAFLDPRGPELEWRTVERLASHKAVGFPKTELLLLFAYNVAITRLMPHDPGKMVNEALLDRFMPNPDAWRRIYAGRASQSAAEYRRTMLEEYVRGLKNLGYGYVPAPYLVHTKNNHPLYFLIFASDHPVGWKIMTWCLEHLPDTRQQPGLFAYHQNY
jgi:three-Cys-motif partner protein